MTEPRDDALDSIDKLSERKLSCRELARYIWDRSQNNPSHFEQDIARLIANERKQAIERAAPVPQCEAEPVRKHVTTGYEQPGDPAFEGGAAYERYCEEQERRAAPARCDAVNAGLPKPETMLTYASILEKPQYWIDPKTSQKYQLATGEIVEAACAALRHCAALSPDPGTVAVASAQYRCTCGAEPYCAPNVHDASCPLAVTSTHRESEAT